MLNHDNTSFDQFNFEKTASVLWHLNKDVLVKQFNNQEELIDYMKQQTLRIMSGAGFWSLYGFTISVSRDAIGDGWYCTATVSPHLVSRYL